MESSRASLALRTHFEVFGLEAHKSSKMSYPLLEDSTFFVSLKMSHGHDLFFTLLGKSAKTSWKIWKEFFFWRSPEKNFGGLFFGGRTLAPCVLGLEKSVPSLGLGFFCVHGLEGCVLDSISAK